MFSNKKASCKHSIKSVNSFSTHDIIPLKDIDSEVMIKKDDSIIVFVRVEPVNLDLLSDKEKRLKIDAYFNVVNTINYPIQFIGISRPVDLESYLIGLNDMKDKETNPIKIKLLEKYYQQAANMTDGGGKTERRYYFILKESKGEKPYQEQKAEVLNRARDFCNQMMSASFKCTITNFMEIQSLLQIYCQPIKATYEKPAEYPGPIVPTVYI